MPARFVQSIADRGRSVQFLRRLVDVCSDISKELTAFFFFYDAFLHRCLRISNVVKGRHVSNPRSF